MQVSKPTRFNYLRAIPASFYSADLYRDVFKRWDGTGFVYLLMITAIIWLLFAAFLLSKLLDDGFDKLSDLLVDEIKAEAVTPEVLEAHPQDWPQLLLSDALHYLAEIPPMRWEDNQLEVDADTMPYYIYQQDTETPRTIFDTSGQYESLEGTEAFLLVTAHRLVLKEWEDDTAGHERVFYLSEFFQDEPETGRAILAFLGRFPLATIDNGILTIAEKEPHLLTLPFPEEAPLSLIFDTMQTPEANDLERTIWFGKDAVYFMHDGVIEQHRYSELNERNLRDLTSTLFSMLQKFTLIALLIASPFIIIVVGVFYFIWAVILAIVAGTVNLILRTPAEIEDIIRITAVALTPGLFGYILFAMTPLAAHYGLFTLSIITLLYVFYALALIKQLPPEPDL